jgi:hypothetical protein
MKYISGNDPLIQSFITFHVFYYQMEQHWLNVGCTLRMVPHAVT